MEKWNYLLFFSQCFMLLGSLISRWYGPAWAFCH